MGASRKRARPRGGPRTGAPVKAARAGAPGARAAAAEAATAASEAAAAAYTSALLSSHPSVASKLGVLTTRAAPATLPTAAPAATGRGGGRGGRDGDADGGRDGGGSDHSGSEDNDSDDSEDGGAVMPASGATVADPPAGPAQAAAAALAAADAAAAEASPGGAGGVPIPLAKNAKVIVLLENANLETVKPSANATSYQLLNSDDHVSLLRKTRRDANTSARPDITHQCLLALMDSPLNKAGHLAVYIRTIRGVLIRVHPDTRIPRTAKRFAGLMVELLHKLKVRSTGGSTPLLQVVANPITSHLPVGCRRVLCSYHTENVVDMRAHALSILRLPPPRPPAGAQGGGDGEQLEDEAARRERETREVSVCYVIGAMAHGKVDADWVEETICVSEYTLSAATVCSRLVYAYECALGVL